MLVLLYAYFQEKGGGKKMAHFSQSNSFSATIHDIEWERIKLNIDGLIEGNINDNFTMFMKKRNSNFYIPLEGMVIKGHSYSVSINIVTINNGDRIPNGKWDIVIINSKKEEVTCKLAINFTYKGRKEFKGNYSKIFKVGFKRLYKVETDLEPVFNHFLLNVELKGSKPKKNKKRNFRQKISHLRIKTFNYIFQFANKYVKKNGRRITFTSASRSEIGGNLGAVYNKMLDRRLDKEYTIYKIFKSNIWARSRWIDKFRLPFLLGISDFIFIEDYQPMVNNLQFDDRTEIIQLWHANGAFKTFGYSRLGKSASPLIDGKNHRIYTKAITSSRHVIPYYAEAFAIDEKNVIATGIPKTDIFFDEAYKKATKEKVLDFYPHIRKANKVILFGPTFRGGGPKTAYYPMDKIDFEQLAMFCRKENAIVIFKMHFLVKNELEIPNSYSDVFINATDYREINDLLFVADVLITDYSSTIYEYSLLNKPMVFYAFDLEEYISSRDFYDEFEGFVPGKIVETFNDLIESLENEQYEFEKVKEFKQKNFEFLDGGASDRVIDMLVLGDNTEN